MYVVRHLHVRISPSYPDRECDLSASARIPLLNPSPGRSRPSLRSTGTSTRYAHHYAMRGSLARLQVPVGVLGCWSDPLAAAALPPLLSALPALPHCAGAAPSFHSVPPTPPSPGTASGACFQDAAGLVVLRIAFSADRQELLAALRHRARRPVSPCSTIWPRTRHAIGSSGRHARSSHTAKAAVDDLGRPLPSRYITPI